MPARSLFFTVLAFAACCFPFLSFAQNGCTTLGQTPSTAFPVCGTDTFHQQTVPLCQTHASITVPGCGSAGYTDKNPFWYTFTCYSAGTLGFSINPNDLNDDYDWQLYDITGHNPDDVFTNSSLVVTGNWSGSSGLTGASATGVTYIQCASDPAQYKPTFSKMPALKQGHTYLLLISHFTDTQSGYSLSFNGGTAVITDTVKPHILSATPDCSGTHLTVHLNKKMKCSSLATDGSDFSISPGSITVTGASPLGCSTGFDMDSVVLTLSAPLPAGNYQVLAKKGSDSNTLLDNCDTPIPDGDAANFTITILQPTPLDSITPVGCGPSTLQLVFKKPIQCSTIATDGSDFSVSGPAAVTVTGAKGNCNGNGETSIITLQLAAPIQQRGDYTVTLKNGGDGNSIVDACGLETPPSTIHFTAYDTVSANFTWQTQLGCKADVVSFYHDGNNGVNQWLWLFDSTATSTQQNPVYSYNTFNDKYVQLIVSNGVCSDTSSNTIVLGNTLKAQFSAPDNVCPQDVVVFTDSSIGQISSHTWNFGNGQTSFLEAPPSQQYNPNARSQQFTVSLVVRNNIGCTDTAVHTITAYNSCYIAVPSAFTPNGDGLNDYLYPLSGFKAADLEFQVFNRYGQRVFYSKDWMQRWDGTIGGLPQPPGTYVWTLSYTHKDTGRRVFQKGTVVLIR